MFLYIGSAILAGIYLIQLLPDGWTTVIRSAETGDKFSIINFGIDKGISSFFSTPYTFIGGIVGGTFLSMASHGTDQLIVQRLFATKNLRSAQKAIIGSGVIVIIQFAIFLVLGVMLYSYYGQLNVKSDEIFPKFIIEILPSGITGIIIAGLFAAAMSTLAGSMSALSSSVMIDIYTPFIKRNIGDSKMLSTSRIFTIFLAALLILSAFIFMNSSHTVIEVALSIASFTYGGLLGTFLLGFLFNNVQQAGALVGFTAGILGMILVIFFTDIGWTWYTLIGVLITIISGIIYSTVITREEIY